MSDAVSALDQLGGTTLGGRYLLGHLLGEGGMGAVFSAADRDGTQVAVKVLRGEVAPLVLQRFEREAELTKKVDHGHVVPVLEFGSEPTAGVHYLVMPMLEGEDLGAVLGRTGRLEPRIAVRIARQACAGLVSVHAVGVVHRDIKPSNLFVDRKDELGTVRLIDFGIGKRIDATSGASLTKTGNVLGTPLYMSPEQVADTKAVTAKTDVFSLAVVLYEMLCGEPPFAYVPTLGEVLVAIASRGIPRLVEMAPWVDPELAAVVHRALERDQTSRPDAATFAELLLPFNGGTDDVALSDLAAPAELPSGRETAATTPVQVDPLVGHKLGGVYEIVRLIGRGGMGSVYEVVGPDEKRFAAKVVSSQLMRGNEATRKRFAREARAAMGISNEHVVRTLELGSDDSLGSPFLLMELLEGEDLASRIRDEGPVAPRAAARAFVQAARGLAAAHARGVIHRDIKPANIFLQRTEGDALVIKIADFGIAKAVTPESAQSTDLTRTGGMLGSPAYMSPEQAQGAKDLDARSDIWSLCISMWETLTGKKPWAGANALGEVIVAICTKPLTTLGEAAPWVDPALARVVHRGLEKDPDARWQTVDEFIHALEPFVGASPDLTSHDMQPLDEATRSHRAVAEVSRVPNIGEDRTVEAETGPMNGPPAVTRRKARWMGALVVALAMVGVIAAVSAARPGDQERAAASASVSSAALPAADATATPLSSATTQATSPSSSPQVATTGGTAPSASPSSGASKLPTISPGASAMPSAALASSAHRAPGSPGLKPDSDLDKRTAEPVVSAAPAPASSVSPANALRDRD